MIIPPCFHRVSVKGLILDHKKRFLLIQEGNGFWDLPGGGMDHGENPETCLKREIYEEMGLAVLSMEKSPSYFYASINPKNQAIVNVVYAISLSNLEFKVSDECVALRFFSKSDVIQLQSNMYPNILEFIKHFEA